ncbi:MAG: signal peptidase II [Parvularculaceae bacterium]|nr:signal peptidase II [Parvularculaceae bacterium]
MKTAGDIKIKAANWFADARVNPLFLQGVIAALIVAALDQASKFWILEIVELPVKRQVEISSIFDLTYTCNRGASFGMLAGGLGSRILLSSISIVIATALVIWLGRLKRRFAAAGAGIIIGGALGNLFDRVRFGCVTDFLDFSGLMFPWIFNIADAAINIGFVCLIIDALGREGGKPAP